MKKIIAKINPITGNKWWSMMANMSAVGCSERETYRLTFDPMYFEREYLQNPKIENDMETKNKNEKKSWVMRSDGSRLGTFGPHYKASTGSWSNRIDDAIKFKTQADAHDHGRKYNFNHRYALSEITEPIYKEGDVLVAKGNLGDYIFIFREYSPITGMAYKHFFINPSGGFSSDKSVPACRFGEISGHASSAQKQQLFGALKKEGKRWNEENKVVEEIPEVGSLYFTLSVSDEFIKQYAEVLKKLTDQIEQLTYDKKKADEMIKRLKDLTKPKLSEMDQFKKDLDEDYEIINVTQTTPVFEDTYVYDIAPRLISPSKLIVTYKPKHK